MAVSQQFLGSPRRPYAARVEQPCPGDRPRLFWDAAAKAWTADPAARVPAVEDPSLPGVYRVQVPDDDMKPAWPDKVYWLAAFEEVGAGAGAATAIVALNPFSVLGGSDGSSRCPSADLTLPDGRTLHLWDAYVR